MRRRAMGVAGLAIAFGVMLVCFGATAGVAERCKPDEHGGHGHSQDNCPDPTVPTTVPATDPVTTPATTPPTTPVNTPATTPATTPGPAPLRSTPPPATSPAPAPTSARSAASVVRVPVTRSAASPRRRGRADHGAEGSRCRRAPGDRARAGADACRDIEHDRSTVGSVRARQCRRTGGRTRVRAHLAADACPRSALGSALRGRVLVLRDRDRASLTADGQGNVIASMSTTGTRAIPAAEPEKAASPNANTPPSAATSQ